MTETTQTIPAFPIGSFLADEMARTAAEKHRLTSIALHRAAYCCAADADMRAGKYAIHHLHRISQDIAEGCPPDTWSNAHRPDYRAAHDYAMLQSETETDPIRAQCWRFIRAHCRRMIAGIGPDRAESFTNWQDALSALSAMERH